MMKQFILVVLTIFFISIPLDYVFAQENSNGSQLEDNTIVATQSANEVFSKERETERIKELRTLYRNQVEVYRNSEKAYIIAKTNFEQVQTLESLEEAVKATKQVMLERSRVMVTYLELLDAILIETNGVELDLKNQSHTEIFGLINAFKIHQDEIAVSSDRQSMAVLSDSFEPIEFSYISVVYKTLSLIRIGQIQEVRDKSEIIMKDIISRHKAEESSSLVVAKRERAYTEIERNFNIVNTNLAGLNSKFLEARVKGFSRSFYERILEDLGPVYVQISKSLDHLEELLKL